MKESKDHLNIDLEFLDKKEPAKVAPKQSDAGQIPPTPIPISTSHRYNWKNILIIGGIVLFIGWVLFSNDNGSSSSSSNTYTLPSQTSNFNTSDDNVMIGEYNCSRYYYNQAVAIEPDETGQQIESARVALEYRTNELERLQNEIENSHVNEYSDQWEIDQYNEMIDEYNSKLPTYKRDAANFETRVDWYNAQVEKYNNYLKANCTKKY